MEENKITNRHVGVAKGWSADEKFRDVRQRSEQDQHERKKVAKKKKIPVPEYEVGQRVVLGSPCHRSKCKLDFVYAEIVDVVEADWDKFSYFAVVLRANRYSWEKRLGHLIHFGAGHNSFVFFDLVVKPVVPESIKWEVWLPEEAPQEEQSKD